MALALNRPGWFCCFSHPLLHVVSLTSRIHSFLRLEAYCLIKILFTEELVPRHARCVISGLGCNELNLLLNSLFTIGRIEIPSCSARSHSIQDIFQSALSCYELFASLALCDSLSLNDLWSWFWSVTLLSELHGLPPSPDPSTGVG